MPKQEEKFTRYFFMAVGVVLIILAVFIFKNQLKNKSKNDQSVNNLIQNNSNNDSFVSAVPSNNPVPQAAVSSSGFVAPIDHSAERITKKPFGIYITTQNSPVQPERFQGYHTGTDFEIFPQELNQDVPVNAICDGNIKVKEWASGYGGVLVEACSYKNQPITVIYGHLNLDSISKNVGDKLNAGEKVGILGNDKSQQTDGERKHLHLGIHKGNTVNILGYVQSQSQLSGWYNPCDISGVCQ